MPSAHYETELTFLCKSVSVGRPKEVKIVRFRTTWQNCFRHLRNNETGTFG